MRKPNARERILETAGKLFHQRGYSEVGINEIIEKAETAKASFYQYYPSKEALCEAWLQSIHDRSESRRVDILSGEGSPARKIERYFTDLESYMVQSEFRGCPYSNTGAVSDNTCTGILEQIREHKATTRKFFQDIAALQFPDAERAKEAGDRLFIIYSGATTECQNLKEIWPIQTARKLAVQLLSEESSD